MKKRDVKSLKQKLQRYSKVAFEP
ncbi:hypothetical protein ACA351_07390 [Orientia tsutsugamushi]